MKSLWFLALVILFQDTKATAITVIDVKVSVTSDSAATAREQALAEAHGLALQKLLKENFPEASRPLPSQDTLENMVTTFSIDKEKTTPQSYAASLTFQFDEPQVHAWLQQEQSPTSHSTSPSQLQKKEGDLLKITASYTTLLQWRHIKNALEQSPGAQKVRVVTLSANAAEIEVTYGGDISQLHKYLRQHKLSLTPQGQGWVIAASDLSPLPKIIY